MRLLCNNHGSSNVAQLFGAEKGQLSARIADHALQSTREKVYYISGVFILFFNMLNFISCSGREQWQNVSKHFSEMEQSAKVHEGWRLAQQKASTTPFKRKSMSTLADEIDEKEIAGDRMTQRRDKLSRLLKQETRQIELELRNRRRLLNYDKENAPSRQSFYSNDFDCLKQMISEKRFTNESDRQKFLKVKLNEIWRRNNPYF